MNNFNALNDGRPFVQINAGASTLVGVQHMDKTLITHVIDENGMEVKMDCLYDAPNKEYDVVVPVSISVENGVVTSFSTSTGWVKLGGVGDPACKPAFEGVMEQHFKPVVDGFLSTLTPADTDVRGVCIRMMDTLAEVFQMSSRMKENMVTKALADAGL